jgi:hypothetical protein
MTELAVAGLVLAVIPLFISAAEHHRDGLGVLDRFFHRRRLLERLISKLKVQDTLLKLQLQSVLGSTTLSPNLQKELVDFPAGKTWQRADVQRQFKELLGPAYETFFETVSQLSTLLLKQVKEEDELHRISDATVRSDILIRVELIMPLIDR